MSKKVLGSRLIHVISNVSGATATVPAPDNNDHTLGWLSTDIYKAEILVNTLDDRVFTRTDNGITEFILLDKITGKLPLEYLPTILPGAGTVTSVKAGYGMNFVDITDDGEVTLGIPSSIHSGSTDNVTATSHTHRFYPAGSDQHIQYNSSGFLAASANFKFDGTSIYNSSMLAGTTSYIVYFNTSNGKLTYGDQVVVKAGSGMTFSDITTTGYVTLGTPSTITPASTNSVTGTTHTHSFTPAGSNTYIQYNSSGVLSASNKFRYDGTDFYVSGMTTGTTTRILYYNLVNGIFTHGDSSALTPTYISSLSDSIATVTTFGGVPSGTTVGSLTGKTFSYIFDMLLFPTADPTKTNNSLVLTGQGTTTVEVGTAFAVSQTASFTRGVITNGNGTTGPYLTGLPSSYLFKLPGDSTGITYTTTNLSQAHTFASYKIPSNSTYTWSVTTNYSAGSGTYYDSKNNPSTILDAYRGASSISATSGVVTGRYYIFHSYGPTNSHPIDSAGVRSITGTGLTFLSSTNTTSNLTGGYLDAWVPDKTQEFYFYTPAGKTVKIYFVDSSLADVTLSFNSGTGIGVPITVNDAGGTPRNYEMWVGPMNYDDPDGSTYRIIIT